MTISIDDVLKLKEHFNKKYRIDTNKKEKSKKLNSNKDKQINK